MKRPAGVENIVKQQDMAALHLGEVPVEEIGVGPGKTSLAKGEIVASFLFPERAPHSGGAYLRFIPRTEMDIAVVGAGVDLTLGEDGVCTRAKVALGAVAERVVVVDDAAAALVGTKVDEAALEALAEVRERLAPLVGDAGAEVRQALAQGQRVMFEGGQGTMLDLSYGTYPYVTSSHPTVGGILVGAGVSHKALGTVVGVVKAFTTRVGHGPFPTEIEDEATGLRLRGTGANQWDEYGTTTGRPRRVGWLDLAQLRYAAEINGFDALVVTKLDVLSGMDTVRVGVGYDETGAPIYEEMPGWGDLRGLGRREALPREVTDYLARIEAFVGVPVAMFSTSPDRADTYGEIAWT